MKHKTSKTGYLPLCGNIKMSQLIPGRFTHPMSEKAFQSWRKFSDDEYPEKYCHFSGEQTHGETSFARPILRKNWSKAKEIHKF